MRISATAQIPQQLIDDLRSVPPSDIGKLWQGLSKDQRDAFRPHLTDEQRKALGSGNPQQQQPKQDQPKPRQQQPMQQEQSSGSKQRDFFKPLSKAVFFCFGIVAIWVCFLNIQPYVRVTEILLGIAGQLAIVRLLLGIPLLGSVIAWIGSIVIPVIGFAIWAIIQYFELLPDLLKQHIGKISPAALKRAGTYRGWTYAIDLLLCIICFPPIRGGMNGFFMFLSSPSFQDLDWWNILYIVVTMFAVEALWKAYQWLQELMKKV